MTSKDVAKYLGVAISTVYTLPIAHYAYGTKRVYEIEDVQAYKNSCRLAGKKAVTGLALTASSPIGESELVSYFRKAGHSVKQTITTKKKPQGSTRLQLVK